MATIASGSSHLGRVIQDARFTSTNTMIFTAHYTAPSTLSNSSRETIVSLGSTTGGIALQIYDSVGDGSHTIQVWFEGVTHNFTSHTVAEDESMTLLCEWNHTNDEITVYKNTYASGQTLSAGPGVAALRNSLRFGARFQTTWQDYLSANSELAYVGYWQGQGALPSQSDYTDFLENNISPEAITGFNADLDHMYHLVIDATPTVTSESINVYYRKSASYFERDDMVLAWMPLPPPYTFTANNELYQIRLEGAV